uniref:Uncharacterized protein n=1 Tax=Marseillevirus LCMAC101 TaxID=2506602 RepID=A0A481YSU6_9VIRU|nr:MAG: hypothetical protein LCMAC101_06550 [Marseillevirus LCMAC101]
MLIIKHYKYDAVLDVNGDPTYTTKPAKNPLLINTMDMLGIAMACIKNLNARIKVLEGV